MFDIFTIGDIKLDTFVILNDASLQCELKMPECKLCIDYGAKIDVKVVDNQIAGSAPNVAIGLARMGKRSTVRSPLGEDVTYLLAMQTLKKEKVDTKQLHTDKKEKSSYSVVMNFKGERTMLTGHIKHNYKLPAKMPKSKWIYLCEMGEGYEGLYKSLLKKTKRNGAKIAMNPGSVQVDQRKKVTMELLKHVDLLFVNKEEARDLLKSKETDIRRLASKLYKVTGGMIVITDGRAGAYGFDGEELYFAKMFPGKRIEATGAGDSFASGFIGALLHGGDMQDGLKWGSVNAANVVQYVGGQEGLLSATAIKKKLKAKPSYKINTL